MRVFYVQQLSVEEFRAAIIMAVAAGVALCVYAYGDQYGVGWQLLVGGTSLLAAAVFRLARNLVLWKLFLLVAAISALFSYGPISQRIDRNRYAATVQRYDALLEQIAADIRQPMPLFIWYGQPGFWHVIDKEAAYIAAHTDDVNRLLCVSVLRADMQAQFGTKSFSDVAAVTELKQPDETQVVDRQTLLSLMGVRPGFDENYRRLIGHSKYPEAARKCGGVLGLA
jgi:hypothetical protein